jgi:large subunit ribosomal protein L4e
MFAPTKIWRRWHRKVNINERRFAVASAVAASGIPALVMARGHKIDQVPEVPLVVDNKVIDSLDKTSKAVALLKAINAYADVERVKDSIKIRPGKGKARNRRYVQKRGPLIVYNEQSPLTKAFRNIPGVETSAVSRLNLLQLAPGGHLGRFIIWTKDAFENLNNIFGTYKKTSTQKLGYKLPRPIVSNADLTRVINSDEIQSVLRPKQTVKRIQRKRNPLSNPAALAKLNPNAVGHKRRQFVANEARQKKKAADLEAKRKGTKVAPTKKEVVKKAVEKKHAASRKKYLAALFAK